MEDDGVFRNTMLSQAGGSSLTRFIMCYMAHEKLNGGMAVSSGIKATKENIISAPKFREILDTVPYARAYFIAALQLGMSRDVLAEELSRLVPNEQKAKIPRHTINNICSAWGLMGGHPSLSPSEKKRSEITTKINELRKGIDEDTLLSAYHRAYENLRKNDPRSLIERDKTMRAIGQSCWKESVLAPNDRLVKFFKIANTILGSAVDHRYVTRALMREAEKKAMDPSDVPDKYAEELSRYFERLLVSPVGDVTDVLSEEDMEDARLAVAAFEDVVLMQTSRKKEGWRAHEPTRLLLAELAERGYSAEQAQLLTSEAAEYLYGQFASSNGLRTFYEASEPMTVRCGRFRAGLSYNDRRRRMMTMTRLLRAETQVSATRKLAMQQARRDARLAIAVRHLGFTESESQRGSEASRKSLWLQAVAHRTLAERENFFSKEIAELIRGIDSTVEENVVLKDWTVNTTINGQGKMKVIFSYPLNASGAPRENDFVLKRLIPELQAMSRGIATELLGALLERHGDTISVCEVRPVMDDIHVDDLRLPKFSVMLPTIRSRRGIRAKGTPLKNR